MQDFRSYCFPGASYEVRYVEAEACASLLMVAFRWAMPGIDCPVWLVATSKDGVHVQGDVGRMAKALPDCTYVDVENNKRSHSAELAILLRAHLNKIIE